MSHQQIVSGANIFAQGFLDSISIYKTFPLLVNNQNIAAATGKIVAANIGLFLGVVTLFNKVIEPALDYFGKEISVDGSSQSQLAGIVFYSFLVVPIYILCFVSSTGWYQNIADEMHKQRRNRDDAPALQSLIDGTYASVAWVVLFSQQQLLSLLLPAVISKGISFLESYLEAAAGDASGSLLGLRLSLLLPLVIKLIFELLLFVVQILLIILMTAMYGWYGFDPHWIASNIDPDTRFGLMEKYWCYFLGFGAPFTLLNRLAPFFYGYGLFLAFFPFCIMLGGISDFEAPYRGQRVKIPPLRVFKLGQSWTLALLQLLGRKAVSATTASSGAKAGKDVESRGSKKKH